jgi:hypothetical protein
MAARLVDAFIDAKLREAATARALYAVATEVEGVAIVGRMAQRGQRALAALLATAPGGGIEHPETVAYVCATAMIGPVQGLLEADADGSAVEAVRNHLTIMLGAYLRGLCASRRMRRGARSGANA